MISKVKCNKVEISTDSVFDKQYNKIYSISRVILTVLVFIFFRILFIAEDESWMVLPFVYAIIAYVFSFGSSAISKKMIKFGYKFNGRKKVIYYSAILPITTFLIIVMTIAVYVILGEFLSFAGLVILCFSFFGVISCIICPYIQTLIVILLDKKIVNNLEMDSQE